MIQYENEIEWLKKVCPMHRGPDEVRVLVRQIAESSIKEDLVDLMDMAINFYRGYFSPQRNEYYRPVVKDATDEEIWILEGYRCGFAREMSFEQIERLELIAARYPLPEGIDPKRCTQFNEAMLKYAVDLPHSVWEKEVILALLGVERNNAIVANAGIYKYHPEMALEDPQGTGPEIPESAVPKRMP